MHTEASQHIEKSDERRARSVPTRRALMEAGASVFASRGFDGATLEAIGEAAGVNKALIRYHFGSKQGLYSAVLLEAIEHGQTLVAPARESDEPPEVRLGLFIDAVGRLGVDRPHFGPMVTREWMSAGAHMEEDVMARLLGFYETHRVILEEGMSRGVFRRVDAHETHLSLVGSLTFFQISEPMRRARQGGSLPSAPNAGEYTKHVKALFLRGLAQT